MDAIGGRVKAGHSTNQEKQKTTFSFIQRRGKGTRESGKEKRASSQGSCQTRVRARNGRRFRSSREMASDEEGCSDLDP